MKALKDWTLGEIQTYCRNTAKCSRCEEALSNFCLNKYKVPEDWDLTEHEEPDDDF